MKKAPSADLFAERLDRAVPDPKIELRHSNPLELLIATILSAQCTDERVNSVTEALFKKYKTAQDYAKTDLTLLESEIKPTGFYKNKAKNIIATAQTLVKKFRGKVPATMEELTSLPGVGRKTANVILGGWFHQPAVVVDTHVKRVSKRVGLTESEDPEEIERDLRKLFPQESWTKVSQQILLFGRYTCKAKTPKCKGCPFYLDCLSKGKW